MTTLRLVLVGSRLGLVALRVLFVVGLVAGLFHPTSHVGSSVAMTTRHRRSPIAATPSVAHRGGAVPLAATDNAVDDLQCPPCDRVHCWPRRPSRLRCPGGVVRGVCNCCPVCARLDGQPCGGRWNYLGRCDAGLYCSAVGENLDGDEDVETTKKLNRVSIKDQSTAAEKSKAANAVWKPEGRCREGQEMNDSPQLPVKCLPLCTPEFCRKNVKQLCSANDNAERRQPCQAECQHTSCSACHFRRPSVDCSESVRCTSPSDTDCLRRFGRCVRRERCAAKGDFPCRTTNESSVTNEPDYKFVCVVPECASLTSS